MDLQISRAHPSDIEACARLLAHAFLHDDVLGRIVRGESRRRERLQDLFVTAMAPASLPAGTVDVARREPGGEIIGVADWHPPDAPAGTRIRSVRELPRLGRAIQVRHLPAVMGTIGRLRRFSPRYPHWHLGQIGAAEPGLGVGTLLLEHRLADVDASGLPAYLEATSAASRRLYERHGFRSIGTFELGAGARVTPMLRPVRPSATERTRPAA